MTRCLISSKGWRRPVRVAVALCIVMVAVLLAIHMIIPSASAEGNLTPSGTPFITIDPIRNYTAGDIFIIHGTTNLPVSNEKSLIFSITTAGYNPGGFRGYSYTTKLAISPGTNGSNQWTINITNISIPVSDDYYIGISSSDYYTRATQGFHVFPPPTPIQSLSLIQLATSATIVPPITSAVTVPPITQVSPLPIILPIAVLAAIVSLTSFNKKKRD